MIWQHRPECISGLSEIFIFCFENVLISTAAGRRSRKDGKTKYLEDRGLEEAVLEPEDRDEFIEAIRAIVSSRKGKSDS